MDTLKKYVLGKRANKYVEESLKLGKTFSNLLAKKYNFNQGQVYTYAPENTPLSKLENFNGGIYPKISKGEEKVYFHPDGKIGVVAKDEQIADPSSWLANEIKDKLASGKANLALIQDTMRNKNDPHVIKNTLTFYYNEEVYYTINEATETQKTKELISAIYNFTPPFVGALIEADISKIQDDSVNKEKLEHFAKEIKYIIVGAYDGEGYIIWDKQK